MSALEVPPPSRRVSGASTTPDQPLTSTPVGDSASQTEQKDQTEPKDQTTENPLDTPLENFDPVPYVFVLKDFTGTPLILPPDSVNNARISCPSYHVLLDHTIAVLWSYYSGKTDLLETAQIHWALKFLEGTKNRFGQYTEDVAMAIDHLQEALVDVCAGIEDEKVDEARYNMNVESTRNDLVPRPGPPPGPSPSTTASPAASPSALGTPANPSLRSVHSEASTGYKNFAQELHIPENINSISVHLDDILSKANPDEIKQLVADDVDPCEEQIRELEKAQAEEKKAFNEELGNWRNEQVEKIICQLEQIKKMDATLRDIRVEATAKIADKLTELLKQSADTCPKP